MSMAPTRMMPWMEFAADISGVCSVAGTLLITSKPTQRLSTKMVRSVSSAVDTGRTSSGLREGGMNHLALIRDHDAPLQVVGKVDGQGALLDQVQQRGPAVARVHRRRGGGHRRRQVPGADDRHAVLGDHGLAGLRPLDVAA